MAEGHVAFDFTPEYDFGSLPVIQQIAAEAEQYMGQWIAEQGGEVEYRFEKAQLESFIGQMESRLPEINAAIQAYIEQEVESFFSQIGEDNVRTIRFGYPRITSFPQLDVWQLADIIERKIL